MSNPLSTLLRRVWRIFKLKVYKNVFMITKSGKKSTAEILIYSELALQAIAFFLVYCLGCILSKRTTATF